MNTIVVDLETSGLHPERNCILSIGAVNFETGSEFTIDLLARSGAEIDQEALDVNGFSAEEIWSPSRAREETAMRAFYAWVGMDRKAILAGMNPRFDLSFLNFASDGYLIPSPFSHRTVDMHTLAVHYAIRSGVPVPDGGFNTDAVYELLGLPPEPKPHVALTGARREATALRLLLGL